MMTIVSLIVWSLQVPDICSSNSVLNGDWGLVSLFVKLSTVLFCRSLMFSVSTQMITCYITRRALNEQELQNIPTETNSSLFRPSFLPWALPTAPSLFWVILTFSHAKKSRMFLALAAAPIHSSSNQKDWNVESVHFSTQLNYCCSWASLTAKWFAQWQRGWFSDSLNYIQITLSHSSRDPLVHFRALAGLNKRRWIWTGILCREACVVDAKLKLNPLLCKSRIKLKWEQIFWKEIWRTRELFSRDTFFSTRICNAF